MNKKSIFVIFAVLILAGVGVALKMLNSKSHSTTLIQTAKPAVSVVSIDDVVREPEKFTGVIGVEGSVIGIEMKKSMFTLGCEDACITMPVQYNGVMPKEGISVIAYGEVKKSEGDKYIFIAQEVKAK